MVAALIVKVVPSVIEATVAPLGMFGPTTDMPMTRPVVLATVMVLSTPLVERPVRGSGRGSVVNAAGRKPLVAL